MNLLDVASNYIIIMFTVDKKSESKENQWLGVVVQSQGPGGKVLVSMT